MESRREILEQKAKEISEKLARWVGEKLHLEPEECFTITLKIEKTVLAVKVPREDGNILDTPLMDFFTYQRCLDIVSDKSLSTKIRDRLTEETRFRGSLFHDDLHLKTVRDLVTFGRHRLLEIRYIGKGTINKIERMLATEGLRLDE